MRPYTQLSENICGTFISFILGGSCGFLMASLVNFYDAVHRRRNAGRHVGQGRPLPGHKRFIANGWRHPRTHPCLEAPARSPLWRRFDLSIQVSPAVSFSPAVPGGRILPATHTRGGSPLPARSFPC